MTTEEKKIYNNGFILGLASKGVIKVIEKLEKVQRGRSFSAWEMVEEWHGGVVEL